MTSAGGGGYFSDLVHHLLMNTKEEVQRADVSSCSRLSRAGKTVVAGGQAFFFPFLPPPKIASSIFYLFSHPYFSSPFSSGASLARVLIKIKLYRSPESSGTFGPVAKTPGFTFQQELMLCWTFACLEENRK